MKSLGFTGTQKGMSFEQMHQVELYVFIDLRPAEVHHGDCIGSDEEFHEICQRSYHPYIHVHPPLNSKKRAECQGDVIYPPKPYLERNQDIVDASEALIATPSGPEELRSGTWATIRQARKKGIPIYIIHPDGRAEVENEGN